MEEKNVTSNEAADIFLNKHQNWLENRVSVAVQNSVKKCRLTCVLI